MSPAEMRVLWLYPDHMNIYADRGNLAILDRRCAWRGIGFSVTGAGPGDRIDPEAHDLLYIGGGQDRVGFSRAHLGKFPGQSATGDDRQHHRRIRHDRGGLLVCLFAKGLDTGHFGLKKRAVANPIARAPTMKAHEADA